MGVFNPSTFSSLLRHIQTIAMTLGINSEDLPTDLENLAVSLANFFNKLFEHLPYFPDMDLRLAFVLLAFILPVFLDVLFIWFTRETISNILHVCVLGASFDIALEFGHLATSGVWVTRSTIGVIVSVLILTGCLVHEIWKRRSEERTDEDESLSFIVGEVSEFYMKDLFPERISRLDKEGLDILMEQKSESLVVKPVLPSFKNITFVVVLMAAFFLLLFYVVGVIPGTGELNILLVIVVATLSLLFIAILIAILIMIALPCCRDAFVKFRVFMRRYCLKLTMFVLDMLYIPICMVLVDLLLITKDGCPQGQYPVHLDGADDIFDLMTRRNLTCAVCTAVTDACEKACSGGSFWYSQDSGALRMSDDVMLTVGPLAVFTILLIVIGIPIYWTYLIISNRQIVYEIPVYGCSAEEKWQLLSERMSTPGIFLFYPFKQNMVLWGAFIPFSKLIAVVLTEISEDIWGSAVHILMCVYVWILAMNVICKPYEYLFNNIFDIGIAVSNVALTFIPLCSYHGYIVPDWFAIPLSAILIVLPLIAFPYSFCRKKSEYPIDPTVTIDQDGNPCEGIIDDPELEINQVHLLTIDQIQHMTRADFTVFAESDVSDSDVFHCDETIIIHSRKLSCIMDEMLSSIDRICDAVNTDSLTSVLKLVSVLLTVGGGWFFGSMLGLLDAAETVC